MVAGLKAKDVALMGILAATYTAGVYVLPAISFLTLNIRVVNILRGVVPFFGWPAIMGLSLGVIISNLISPLGPIDLLSAAVVFASLSLAYIISKRFLIVCFVPVWLSLSAWVSFMISFVGGVDYMTMFLIITPQIFISDYILPTALAYALKKAYKRIPAHK